MRAARTPAAALALVLSTLAAPVQAQDAAAAKALFNEGLADMEAAHYDTGCPALAESYKLDPRPGTLFTLAECENKRGRIATAVARYDEYVSFVAKLPADQQKKQVDRLKAANEQKAALAPLLPLLTLTLPPDAPKGTVVKRDGTELAANSLGVALPVDPGEHVISTQVPGGAANERRVTLYKGEKKQILVDVRPTGAARPPVNALQPKPKSKPEVVPGPAPGAGGDSGPSGRRLGAYVAGGVGIAGLVLGGVMGGLTLAKKSVINKNCGFVPGDPMGCNDEGLKALSSAKTTGLVSTVGFAVGGAGVVAATVLLLTEPKRAPVKQAGMQAGVVSMGREGATIGLRGAW